MEIVAIVVAVVALLIVVETRGRMAMMEKAPILRQYVEKYVTAEGDEEKAKKMMQDMEKQFHNLYGFGGKMRLDEKELV